MTLIFRRSRATAAFVLLVLSAVATAQQPKPQPPLAAFVGQRIAVMPVQLLRADTVAFVRPAAWDAFRRELDDSIGSAIAERGVGKKWAYAADIARSARRNAAYVSDPYSLGVQPLRNPIYKVGDKIPGLFASNLRPLIALGDTRFALVPVEVAFVGTAERQRAVLRLALVDGRGGLFVWVGDVASDAASALTPALIGSLAARVADLVIAP
ncbi:MAG TPA: hypothetical protein VHE78_19760 [Gemmatimonadaceae bacterium]|nr:hypothetical protein [Gemmatimonadaceae bacterium]